jgi:hypothetical protein
VHSYSIIKGAGVAKATIKSKTGAVITVEGSETEVSNILSNFERTATVVNAKQSVAKRQVEKKENRKRSSASDLIIGLKESGFFDKPKGLAEISEALEEGGFLYPVTSLSGVVLGLVQKRVLRRKKIDRRWVYGK